MDANLGYLILYKSTDITHLADGIETHNLCVNIRCTIKRKIHTDINIYEIRKPIPNLKTSVRDTTYDNLARLLPAQYIVINCNNTIIKVMMILAEKF